MKVGHQKFKLNIKLMYDMVVVRQNVSRVTLFCFRCETIFKSDAAIRCLRILSTTPPNYLNQSIVFSLCLYTAHAAPQNQK